MKTISIIIPRGQYSIVNIAGSYQILNWANDMYYQQSRKQLFNVEFVGVDRPSNDTMGLYSVSPTKTIREIEQTDLIIVPAVHESPEKVFELNKELLPWISAQYAKGAEVAAYCIGVFMLAQTGLLNGKSCSTHWGSAHDLQLAYPDIQVESEKIVTESDGIYTSGGAYAFTNLVIHLIEKYGGRELALMTAKAFMINIENKSQSVFAMFTGQKNHNDGLVLKVQQEIEDNFTENLTIHELSERFAVNRRTLERKFKSATGNTILEYFQRVRIESSKRTLETSGSVNEAMFQSGYKDPKAFREVFKKYAGVSPSSYKKKYYKELVW